MFEKQFVPLYLAKKLKRVVGKTRFQKLVCIVQGEAKRRGIGDLGFDYEPYHHGPFSSELAATIEDLVDEGYILEVAEETPNGNMIHVYELTASGESLLGEAMKKNVIKKRFLSVVDDVSKKFGYLKLPELVEEAYKEL